MQDCRYPLEAVKMSLFLYHPGLGRFPHRKPGAAMFAPKAQQDIAFPRAQDTERKYGLSRPLPVLSQICATLFRHCSPTYRIEQDKVRSRFPTLLDRTAGSSLPATRRASHHCPALVLFNEDRPTRVETDASSIGMGAVLQQEIAQESGDQSNTGVASSTQPNATITLLNAKLAPSSTDWHTRDIFYLAVHLLSSQTTQHPSI